MTRFSLLLLLLFAVSGARADSDGLLSSKEILGHCVIAGQLAVMPWGVKITTNDASAIACLSFLGAVNDTHAHLVATGRITPRYCIPPYVTLDDFATLLENHSREDPPDDRSAGEYILDAYIDTFPCD